MIVEYTITEDEFVSAGRLFLKTRRPRTVYRRMIQPILWAVMFACTLAVGLAQHVLRSVAPFLVILSILPAAGLLVRFQLRRQYRNTTHLHDLRTLELDSESLRFLSTQADARVQWNLFLRFAENEAVFILVQQGNQIFFPVPKRGLTLAQTEELRGILQARIVLI